MVDCPLVLDLTADRRIEFINQRPTDFAASLALAQVIQEG